MSATTSPSTSSAESTFILIDGHSLAFRAYYAFSKGREGGLRTSTGIPTSVCFGFLKNILEILKTQKPEYLAVAFDLGGPTFRHEADDTYKAGRSETPEDFIPDLENLQELLTAMNLPIVVAPGYEADDVIGTLATQGREAGFRVKILSGDRDLFQLVDDDHRVTVLYLSNIFSPAARSGAAPNEFGPEEVIKKLEVTPQQVVDYKALCGDSSDNIPGVKGIGHKTAVKLISEYETLDKIYAAVDQVKGAVQKKLIEGKESAYHSQFMAQIALEVPLEIKPADCKLQGFERTAIVPVLEKLEFQSFLSQINDLLQQFGGKDTPIKSEIDSDPDTWFFSAEETAVAQTPVEPVIFPQIIDTTEKLTALVQRLQKCKTPVAWDTETNSLSPRDAELVGIGCCWQDDPKEIAYIPISHVEGQNLEKSTALEALRPVLESENHPKVLQNAKFDRLVLRHQGIALAGVTFDTMLASYVINPEQNHNLTDLSRNYLQVVAQSYKEIVKKGQTIADLPISNVAEYCGLDVYTTLQLSEKLGAELDAIPELYQLLMEVELPLEAVLADMETAGVKINQEYLQSLSEQLGTELQQLETQAYEMAGEIFNLGSPKQLSEILFTKLELDVKKSRKTKLGYSTDAATLEKLKGDHPLIEVLLSYRTLAKLKSTYVDALPALVREDTQRVHTDFNQAVTATGRLSSSNPNLQNIPIRTEFSRQIRAAFVPEPGWILMAADYSQIELRILAHLSQEPRLVDAYRQGQDVHTLTAKLLLEKEEISSEERRLAKIINFGVIYGMGPQRFAREAGVKWAEAKEFIQKFYDRYPGVFDYLQRMEREAVAKGYVETILGRRRYFNFDSRSLTKHQGKPVSEITNLDLSQVKMSHYDRGLLRAAANAPIQGSSADLIKVAMVQLHEVLKPFQAQLLMQVHDELVLEVPPEEVEEVRSQIKTTMETALPLSIPLIADVHEGKNWMETK
ncbi:DNA polymerase I [Acaryochloris thomasi RCC1774]|uniref:DNA polymerase I n=1 Tax=Acaryochloris thomasi RCC1774 TaxID=1764569 RepID=A0A2W1JNZ0_9CYAN|nr:DNA polymerase I [Acaryochloris thomasi]PZD72592.1 DNA polymerase I [Acaryochloris thomasi RCC1774]